MLCERNEHDKMHPCQSRKSKQPFVPCPSSHRLPSTASSHLAASAHWHLDSLAPAHSASRPSRLVLCSQQIQVYAQGGPRRTGLNANVLLTPSLPLSRPFGLPVCLSRLPAARLFDRKPAAEIPHDLTRRIS